MTDIKSTRRGFIAGATATVAGATVAGTALNPTAFAQDKPAGGKSRIVQVEHSGATKSMTKLDEPTVEKLIDEALKAYAKTDTATAALAKYFDPKQKIAIKINTLGSPYSSVNPEVAFHLAKLLVEMGAPPDNVRIFDQYVSRMRTGRYRLRRRSGQVWVTNHLGRHGEPLLYEDGKRKVRFHWDKMIVWADAVLNVPIPKDHDLTGVTGALKNMAMGVVKPTKKYYDRKDGNPGHYTIVPRFHRNNCDPALPWLYSQDMIKGKVKLIVADALRLLYHGGPQDKARYRMRLNQIWVAEDPVAVDSTILTLVNKVRQDKGMKPVEEDLFRGKKRLPTYLKTAETMGLGFHDSSRIVIEKSKIG